MNTKLAFVAYPAVALLSLAAAFSAQAQSANNPIDSAAYGPTVVDTPASRAGVKADFKLSLASLFAHRTQRDNDEADRAAYGATVVPATWQRSRAEVRAEAIAARKDGYDAQYLEGADPWYVAMHRARPLDTTHVMAAAPAALAK